MDTRPHIKSLISNVRGGAETELWPTYMIDELGDYMDGLTKLKRFISKFRDGLRAGDVCVLTNTLKRWHGLPVGSGTRHFKKTSAKQVVWDEALITTFCALFECEIRD